VTALKKQKDLPTRTKTDAAPDDGYNKKAILEDKYTDEKKEEERMFAVNLEAMDTPLRGKGSSHITEKTKKGQGRKLRLQKQHQIRPQRLQRNQDFCIRV
jgi:hypothetical protein